MGEDMTILIIAVLALLASLVQPAPTLAQERGAQTRQILHVDVTVPSPEGRFQLTGDSWLQVRLTPEDGGTRVEGITDWHDVTLREVPSERTYHATNDLHFSAWIDDLPPFAFDLATVLTEQDGIYYYFEHPDGDHELVTPHPPPLRVAFTIHGKVDWDGGIQASYGDVRIGCDRCRP
jgi:hypothetical protein